MPLSIEEIEKRIADSYELPNNVIQAMPEPMVTVRTSTYQHGPYIKECIEGILMQKTTFPVEYIIGEDFSKDDTREIVFEYAKKYPDKIRVLTADYNVGSKANGRRCIVAARGKYMAICEGDDYWTDPYKLQKQVDFLEVNKDYSFCFHDSYILTSSDKKLSKRYMTSRKVPNKELILGGGSFVPTASIIARSHFIKSAPDWYKLSGGDYFLVIMLLNYGKVYFMSQTMSTYRFLVAKESWSNSIFETNAFTKRLQHHKRMIGGLHTYNKWSNYKFDKYIKIMINKSRKSILSDQFDTDFKENEYHKWHAKLNNRDKLDLYLIKNLPIFKKVINRINKTKRFYFG